MTRDQFEELLRRYLSVGVTVFVVLAGPGTGDDGAAAPPAATVQPDAAAPRSGSADDRADRGDAADEAETAGEATSAAAKLGWGTPNRIDHFTDRLGPDWNVYDGPGHQGEGQRSPGAADVDDGILTITGDPAGTTAGMSWGDGQRYGRWEGRVKAPEADDSYHALLLLWPDAENFPVGGEIDFMEMLDGDRRTTNLFLHYGEDNSQVSGDVEVDAPTWHNWALEWTPDAITAYLDGEQWFRTTDREIFPPGPMHLCIQLDWFPDDGRRTAESQMQVDWVKQYPLDDGRRSDHGGGAEVGDGRDSDNKGGDNKNSDNKNSDRDDGSGRHDDSDRADQDDHGRDSKDSPQDDDIGDSGYGATHHLSSTPAPTAAHGHADGYRETGTAASITSAGPAVTRTSAAAANGSTAAGNGTPAGGSALAGAVRRIFSWR